MLLGSITEHLSKGNNVELFHSIRQLIVGLFQYIRLSHKSFDFCFFLAINCNDKCVILTNQSINISKEVIKNRLHKCFNE